MDTNGNLTVNLHLSNAQNLTLGTNYTLFGQTNAVLTIIDNEFGPGQIGFASSVFTVGESAGNFDITLIRTNGSEGFVNVDFSLVDGTAVRGVHYNGINLSTNWPDGDSNPRFMTVSITNDAVVNADRTVNLRLGNFVSNSTAGITNAVLTIQNDDSVIGFSPTNYTVNETNGSVSIFLTVRSKRDDGLLDLDDGVTGVGITGGAYVPVAVGAGKTTRGGSLVDVNGDWKTRRAHRQSR